MKIWIDSEKTGVERIYQYEWKDKRTSSCSH